MKKRTEAALVLAMPLVLALTAGVARGGAEEGKTLYDQKCKACHSIGGDAGKMANLGGKLDGVGTKRDAAWLKEYIADPKAKVPGAKMPKVSLTPPQVDDVIAYLLTLK